MTRGSQDESDVRATEAGTVLVVDHADAELATALDTALPYPVRTPTGRDAVLDTLDASPVACVVASDAAPGADCIDLLSAIRDDHPHVPVVLVVDAGRESLVQAALDQGVADVLRRTGSDTDDLVLANRVQRAIRDAAMRGDEKTQEDARIRGRSTTREDTQKADDQSPDHTSRLDQLALLEQVITQVPVSLYLKDTEARHLFISELDVDPARVIGKTDLEVYDESHANETYADDIHVITTGESIDNKEEYNPVSGEWMLTSKVPWRGDDGEILGLIGVTRFVTEKKEYERQLNEKNERLEEFANVVGHDLRNPLNVASGNLTLARSADSDDDRADALERVAAAHDRMAEILEDLLTLARAGQAIDATRPVTLYELASDAWGTVDTADATLELGHDLRFDADAGRLRQLLENLYANAITHAGTDVTVTVEALPDDTGFVVADDGPGIDPEVAANVFDPGVTTRADGTGFGLAIVNDIAESHGWTASIGAADRGTRIEIQF